MFELDNYTKAMTTQALYCFLSANYLTFDKDELDDPDAKDLLEYISEQSLEKFISLIQSNKEILKNIAYWFENKPIEDTVYKVAERYL